MAKVLVEHCPVPMRRVGVKQRYGQVGALDYLMNGYELTAQHRAAGVEFVGIGELGE